MTAPGTPRLIWSTGPYFMLHYLIPALVILLLLTICTGCLAIPRPTVTPATAAPPAQQGNQTLFIFQNVVANASLTGNALERNQLPEERTAIAISRAMDSDNPVTRDFAVSRIPYSHGGLFNAAQVCDLWETVSSRWTYVEDPRGTDYFSPASSTITLGLKGDCDDYAIVVASMIESVGGESRIVSARNGTYAHAYPEVYIGTTQEEYEAVAAYIRERYLVTDVGCHITRDGDVTRYWLNLDWGSRYPGGKFFEDSGERTAYYPDGRWEKVES